MKIDSRSTARVLVLLAMCGSSAWLYGLFLELMSFRDGALAEWTKSSLSYGAQRTIYYLAETAKPFVAGLIIGFPVMVAFPRRPVSMGLVLTAAVILGRYGLLLLVALSGEFPFPIGIGDALTLLAFLAGATSIGFLVRRWNVRRGQAGGTTN